MTEEDESAVEELSKAEISLGAGTSALILASTAQTVLDYIDALAWPLLVLFLGGGSVVLFRDEVSQLIRNIREARFPGGSIIAEPERQDPAQAQRLGEELRAAESPTGMEQRRAKVTRPSNCVLTSLSWKDTLKVFRRSSSSNAFSD